MRLPALAGIELHHVGVDDLVAGLSQIEAEIIEQAILVVSDLRHAPLMVLALGVFRGSSLHLVIEDANSGGNFDQKPAGDCLKKLPLQSSERSFIIIGRAAPGDLFIGKEAAEKGVGLPSTPPRSMT